jgi:MFS family permease
VVGLPIFLTTTLGWGFAQTGGYMALWVIGYGIVQSFAPHIVGRGLAGRPVWALFFLPIPAAIAIALGAGFFPAAAVLGGLVLFGIVFAVNSSLHSYLIVAYAEGDRVAMNIGFYYMANAGGRLTGTLLSGLVFQWHGLIGCLWVSAGLILASSFLASFLPKKPPAPESRSTEDVQNPAEG